jgi:threonine dehydrogenase-like Zn-dependent dehydrogenase
MMQKLLPLVQSGELADATQVITHRMPMSQGVQAYKMFDQKKDGMVKCVLDPWA